MAHRIRSPATVVDCVCAIERYSSRSRGRSIGYSRMSALWSIHDDLTLDLTACRQSVVDRAEFLDVAMQEIDPLRWLIRLEMQRVDGRA